MGALKGGVLAGGVGLMKNGFRTFGTSIKAGLGKTAAGAGVFAGGVYSITRRETPEENYSQYQRAVKTGGTSNISNVFQESTAGLVQGLNRRRHG